MNLLKPLTVAALLCAASVAHADITTYTSRASFSVAAMSAGIDTFNDLSIAPLDTPLARSAGPYHYVANVGPNSTLLFGAGAGGDGWLSTNTAFDTITFSGFAPGITAAGANFFSSDINGQALPGRSVVVTVFDGVDTVHYTLDNTSPASFVGFTSSRGIQSLAVATGSTDAYWTTVNDLTLAQMVPEPHAYALLLAGFLSFGLLAERRRRVH